MRLCYSSQPSFPGAPYPELKGQLEQVLSVSSVRRKGLVEVSKCGAIRGALTASPQLPSVIIAKLVEQGHEWASEKKKINRLLSDMSMKKHGVSRIGPPPYKYFRD